MTNERNETIAAVATGTGGAVALIRISGERAVPIGDALFRSIQGKPLSTQRGYTIHYGTIRDGEAVIDEVLVSLFRAPHSYTGEDMIEISCHASDYILRRVMELAIRHGARTARPGEFTLRAFLAGKMDLSQAEAVADVIASDNRAAHDLAFRQMRGGYSDEFGQLREKLVHLVSLLELELDFGEEDVEFADREQLLEILTAVERKITRLISSFALGNSVKNGIPVAIAGAPNVGKSTLLNALLKEDRALVSDIAGTTRDVIEEPLNIDGLPFRFIDTAGIRETDDPLESMGIERTYDRIGKAAVVLLVADARDDAEEISALYAGIPLRAEQRLIIVLNKCDRLDAQELASKQATLRERISVPVEWLSAKFETHLDGLLRSLRESVRTDDLDNAGATVVFNARHHEALLHASESLARARQGIEEGLPGDLLSQDIREVLHHLGTITGEITTNDILGSIFSRFCVGK